MKTLLYTLILFIVTCVVSCSNNEQNTTSQTENNTDNNVAADSIAKINADSIAKIEAIEKAKADSIAKAKADSLEKINNPHPDLKLFDLRGPVKSCKSDESHRNIYRDITFNPNGSLASISFKLFNKIHKNSNGLTTHLSGKFYDDDFEEWVKTEVKFITDSSGKVIKLRKSFNGSTYYNGGNWDEIYTFDSNGRLSKITTHGLTDGTETISFTYLEFDKYNNWIKRKFQGYYNSKPAALGGIETRTITYY